VNIALQLQQTRTNFTMTLKRLLAEKNTSKGKDFKIQLINVHLFEQRDEFNFLWILRVPEADPPASGTALNDGHDQIGVFDD
jgi:hypothetical protein